ncbi:hypothetical protein PEE20_15980 [Salmonella enterica subsp. enterica serovar Bispebjerg]|uniref:hypothetical protein n=1 Tax=Salmonella enterica TaxID=28901 RepID=UPI0022E4B1C1|nr:hypothetical protein [Salmonella enterica]WBQ81058.1 hypothetical protein PEE20_15980 [Salmonella enterica subsp. enterica serovar Bispebjerg]
MTNYAKLGEYLALKRQAEDATTKRSRLLNEVIRELHRLSECYEEPLDLTLVRRELESAVSADKEMRAAVKQANEAAPLCGEPEIKYLS